MSAADPIQPTLLLAIAERFENSSNAIGGFSCGQWAVVRDLRMPGDMNNVLYRGPVHDRKTYREALLVARMRYALEIFS